MKNHRSLGHITVHHLVPRARIGDFYGTLFHLPKNKLKLWEFKHAAWHVLFKLRTISEIIAYLDKNKYPYGYGGAAWLLLFGNKTSKQARNLLIRVRRISRKRYMGLEFDELLKEKVKKYHKQYFKKDTVKRIDIYLNNRFRKAS